MTQTGLGGAPQSRIGRTQCLFDIPTQVFAEYFQAQRVAIEAQRVCEMFKHNAQTRGKAGLRQLRAGAQRLLQMQVRGMLRMPAALPLRWGLAQLSPVLAATGQWD